MEERPLKRELLIAWLHLAVLWSLAFAQPLFDVLADSPEFFVVRGNTRGDILVFAFAMVVLPPTAMALVEAAFARLPTVRRVVHLAFVAVLVAALALQIVDDALGASTRVLLLIAGLAGALAAYAYARTRLVPTILTVLGPAPLVFLLIFLLISPVHELVLPQDIEQASTTQVDSKTPVVFVVFDEFDPNMLMDRRERIDATRYPSFARLARDGTWYRNATTTNSATTLAVPSVLSGRRAPGGALPTQADFPNSIFTLLGGSYEFHVEELATQLCPEELCGSRTRGSAPSRVKSLVKDLGVVSLHLLLPESLRSGLPAVDRTFGDFQNAGRDSSGSAGGGGLGPPASSVTDRAGAAQRLLQGIGPQGDKPSFDFAHLVLPHVPWQYLPSGQQYPPSEPDIPGLRDEVWDPNPIFARLGLQRHLLQVGYSDRLVGELLDRLRRAGLYDEALVVITADHGVSYRAGEPRRAPTPENLSDIAAIPLFIKYPHQREGGVDDTLVRSIDVVPTIAHALHFRMPYAAEGKAIRSGHDASEAVSVDSGRNAAVTEPLARFIRARQAGLRRMIAEFGAGDSGTGLYATSDYRGLLGHASGPLLTDDPPPGRVDFSNAQVFATLRPSAAVIPSFLSGRVSGAVEPGTPVAVAVNGRVRGVSETFSDGTDTRVAVMVPPQSFRAGRNRVEVAVVRGPIADPKLTTLAVPKATQYRLVEKDGSEVLEGGGSDVPVEAGRVQGAIDDLARDGSAIRVGGWAASESAKRPASRLLVFADGRLLAQGTPDVGRPDIVKSMKTFAVGRSGYRFRVSAAGIDEGDIRVIAIYHGDASSLPVYRP